MLVASFAVSSVFAADSECLQPGDAIGAFTVTKIAGPDDGVAVGADLCYRCKYGSRPMVLVFARNPDESLVELLHQLDEQVSKNESSEFKGLLVMLGEDESALKDVSKKFAEKAKLSNVPVTVASDYKSGPEAYKLSPEDELTVIVAKEGAVVARHSGSAGKLDIEKVMGDVKTMLQ
jgi:hypothetical protein